MTSLKVSIIVLLFIGLITINSACKKEDPALLPVLSTATVTNIRTTTALSGGNITSDGGGTINSHGVCWNTTANPTINDSKKSETGELGIFISNITGLIPNSTYYLRAYATNKAGTAYGNEISFRAYAAMDVDDNGYYSVLIGSQIWMTENLNTTKYNDGVDIPFVTVMVPWYELSTGAYFNYDNNPANSENYGRLYSWYVGSSYNEKNVSPDGWHVASGSEWHSLIDYLGGSDFAGSKLKEISTTHWKAPNTGATNETGFSGLPGGSCGAGPLGTFNNIGTFGRWWSSSPCLASGGEYFGLDCDTSIIIFGPYPRSEGLSIRCIKDN